MNRNNKMIKVAGSVVGTADDDKTRACRHEATVFLY